MVTGALKSHFSDVEKNLQFVHLRERLERMKFGKGYVTSTSHSRIKPEIRKSQNFCDFSTLT